MFGPTSLRGLNLCPTIQAGNPVHLPFGEIIVNALQARLNRSSGHTWPPGVSLPTSGLERMSTWKGDTRTRHCYGRGEILL